VAIDKATMNQDIEQAIDAFRCPRRGVVRGDELKK